MNKKMARVREHADIMRKVSQLPPEETERIINSYLRASQANFEVHERVKRQIEQEQVDRVIIVACVVVLLIALIALKLIR